MPDDPVIAGRLSSALADPSLEYTRSEGASMARSISMDEAATRARSGDAEAQYALSSVLYQRREWSESLHWLRLAAAQALIPAQLTLATLLIDGRQCPRDPAQAMALLRPLAATETRANLLLGELHGFAALGLGDRETALRYVCAAARRGDAGALRQMGLLAVLHRRWDLVCPLLHAAAGRGDAAARALTRRHAPEIGGAPPAGVDWTSVEHALPVLAADLALPPALTLRELPSIRRLPALIHPLVLDMLVGMAAPLVQRSQIVDAQTGEVRADPMRNSSHVTLGPRQHDHVLEALERCIGRVCGIPVRNGEFLQILRYRVGEEFRPHVDYFNEGAAGTLRSLADGGQRVQTALIYLNEGYAGGSTHFPRLGLAIEPRRGDLVHFHNVGADGRGLQDSLHAGMPVLSGEKWLLSQWIRREPYPPRVTW
jgi:prolyl 4-hydroxylase